MPSLQARSAVTAAMSGANQASSAAKVSLPSTAQFWGWPTCTAMPHITPASSHWPPVLRNTAPPESPAPAVPSSEVALGPLRSKRMRNERVVRTPFATSSPVSLTRFVPQSIPEPPPQAQPWCGGQKTGSPRSLPRATSTTSSPTLGVAVATVRAGRPGSAIRRHSLTSAWGPPGVLSSTIAGRGEAR